MNFIIIFLNIFLWPAGRGFINMYIWLLYQNIFDANILHSLEPIFRINMNTVDELSIHVYRNVYFPEK